MPSRAHRWRGPRARRAAKAAAAVVAVLIAIVALRPANATPSYRADGAPLPLPTESLAAITAAEFSGVMVGLRGKPVVVNIWASWCGPCRAEMPLLERASHAYAARVAFVGVASQDSRRAALGFLTEVGATYPNVFDETGAIRGDLSLHGFPTTYLFDRAGRLRAAVVGGITEQRLAAQLDDLLR